MLSDLINSDAYKVTIRYRERSENSGGSIGEIDPGLGGATIYFDSGAAGWAWLREEHGTPAHIILGHELAHARSHMPVTTIDPKTGRKTTRRALHPDEPWGLHKPRREGRRIVAGLNKGQVDENARLWREWRAKKEEWAVRVGNQLRNEYNAQLKRWHPDDYGKVDEQGNTLVSPVPLRTTHSRVGTIPNHNVPISDLKWSNAEIKRFCTDLHTAKAK